MTLAAGGALFVAMANPAAAAEEVDKGVATGEPSGAMTCIVEVAGATGCFKPYGDVIYTRDNSFDAYSVYAKWQNQIRDSSGTWHAYRNGKCTNDRGQGDWAKCDKNFYEASTTNAYGGKGSRIKLTVCVANLGDDHCATTPWLSNDS
ncbi:hypothetical protein ACFUJY_09495 [Streptomyces sp. NPDC057249]|uniref:hypothetical protein n=1 Tax=Streptomyces sp. NPDC057249 TaxID=3346067 RepID=UPI00363698E2